MAGLNLQIVRRWNKTKSNTKSHIMNLMALKQLVSAGCHWPSSKHPIHAAHNTCSITFTDNFQFAMTLGTNSTTQSLQKHILKSWNKGKLMAQNDFLNLYLFFYYHDSPFPFPNSHLPSYICVLYGRKVKEKWKNWEERNLVTTSSP